MHIATLKIKHTDGYTIINADDFDPSVHELFEEPVSQVVEDSNIQLPDELTTQVTVQPTAPTPPEPKAVRRLVKKKS